MEILTILILTFLMGVCIGGLIGCYGCLNIIKEWENTIEKWGETIELLKDEQEQDGKA